MSGPQIVFIPGAVFVVNSNCFPADNYVIFIIEMHCVIRELETES